VADQAKWTKAAEPSSGQLWIITKYEFSNFFRARRFYVLMAITLIVSGAVTAVVGYYRPFGFLASTYAFYGGWWGSFVNIFIILSAIFFGGDAISGEFQNKTGYYLVPNPLRRSVIYVGKYIAAVMASVIVVATFALITVANGLYYFGPSIPSEFGESVAFALFYLLAVMGATFLFSSLFKSSSISILTTVIIFLFAFNLVDEIVMILAGYEPWFSITYAAGIIGDILTVPYPTTQTTGVGRFRITTFVPSVPEGLLIMAVYLVVCTVLGLVLFERKEFT
jgi:ABC-2 type transport system permease protein